MHGGFPDSAGPLLSAVPVCLSVSPRCLFAVLVYAGSLVLAMLCGIDSDSGTASDRGGSLQRDASSDVTISPRRGIAHGRNQDCSPDRPRHNNDPSRLATCRSSEHDAQLADANALQRSTQGKGELTETSPRSKQREKKQDDETRLNQSRWPQQSTSRHRVVVRETVAPIRAHRGA